MQGRAIVWRFSSSVLSVHEGESYRVRAGCRQRASESTAATRLEERIRSSKPLHVESMVAPGGDIHEQTATVQVIARSIVAIQAEQVLEPNGPTH